MKKITDQITHNRELLKMKPSKRLRIDLLNEIARLQCEQLRMIDKQLINTEKKLKQSVKLE